MLVAQREHHCRKLMGIIGNLINLRKNSSSFYRSLERALEFMGKPEFELNNIGKRGKTAFSRPVSKGR